MFVHFMRKSELKVLEQCKIWITYASSTNEFEEGLFRLPSKYIIRQVLFTQEIRTG